MPNDLSCPVVGIGASAGGLEAVKDMLGAVPMPCGMAFVLIQHLDPNHESMMAELIDRRTPLRVRQVAGGELVEADHVYVIPPGFQLTIEDGLLSLSPFAEPRGLRRPIDDFFVSLGEDQGPNVACVVLSGTGGDGSTGLRAVKEHGGIVTAQQPDTAAYDGMPMAAIGTGLVDFILPPDMIFAKLQGYFERRRESGGAAGIGAEITLHLPEICEALRATTGHDFSGYKRPTLLRRIERRMQVLATQDAGEYLRRIRSDERECDALFQDVLINVTNFFRDPEMFESLAQKVIRPLVEASSPGAPIRVWVPGCSSGEEAYTLAILFAAMSEEIGKRPPIQIFATDIDPQMLNLAREARYPLSSLKDIPEPYREKYMIGLEGRFQVAPRLRDMVQFSAHSVIKDPPFSKLDLVSCRNMLIYMGDTIQDTFIPLMHYALKEGGTLFLGPSEGIGRNETLFEPIDQKSRIFRRRPGQASYPLGFPSARDMPRPRTVPGQQRRSVNFPVDGVASEAVERILDRYAHATLVLDDLGNILASHGKLSKFLEFPAGQSTMHAVSLARHGLAEALGPMLRRAVEHGKRVATRNVDVRSEMGTQTIDLVVDPLPDGTLLAVLVEVGAFRAEVEDDLIDDMETDDRFHDLEEELRHTRFRLRTAVEELETANEELKSSNEEMMSMNEELQSANEELSTLNEELKNKVDQLSLANDDVSNLMESTEIGLVVIDAETRVRSYTQPIAHVFPLKDGDKGRSLGEVACLVADERIVEDARSVIAGADTIERLVSSRDGQRHYAMRILPYRSESRVQGATLTFADVTRLVGMERTLRAQADTLQLALEAAKMGVWDVEVDTMTTTVDQTMRDVWELGDDEDFTVESFMEKIEPEDRDAVTTRLEATVATGEPFHVVFRMRNSTGLRWIQGEARMRELDDGARHVTGVNFDITNERLATEGREFLLREINHRVKNLFAIVPAMLAIGAKESSTVPELVENVRGRIGALGRAHQITQGRTDGLAEVDAMRGIDLHALVETVLEPYAGNGSLDLSGEQVTVARDTVTPIGLILHEWATNSAKYGSLSQETGQVRVDWSRADGRLRVDWRETDGPPIERTVAEQGFGSKLVSYSARQLAGDITTEWPAEGISLSLRVPMTEKESA